MDHNLLNNIETVAEKFSLCSKMLTAIGDETRQHLILEMMKMKNCNGVWVVEITEKTNLSRPAVFSSLANYERGRNFKGSQRRNKKLLLF